MQLICCSICQLTCGADKDIMYVFKIFMRHLDALHPSCAVLLATILWCLMSYTPLMQCDADNAGSQVKVIAFNGPSYAGVLLNSSPLQSPWAFNSGA